MAALPFILNHYTVVKTYDLRVFNQFRSLHLDYISFSAGL